MTLTQYTAAVNKIARDRAQELNDKHANGEILFGAFHHDFPEGMMKYYHDNGITPAEAVEIIEDESAHEAAWEARVS